MTPASVLCYCFWFDDIYCDVPFLQIETDGGDKSLSVLYAIKLSCYWHDFCDQLDSIYSKEIIRESVHSLLNLSIVVGRMGDLLMLLETLYFLIIIKKALHRQKHSGPFIFTTNSQE